MKVYSQFIIIRMFVEHMIITDMLEESSEFEFLKLICIKGLRETEQYIQIIVWDLYVENARGEIPFSSNKYW